MKVVQVARIPATPEHHQRIALAIKAGQRMSEKAADVEERPAPTGIWKVLIFLTKWRRILQGKWTNR